jgi:hypothetical protein
MIDDIITKQGWNDESVLALLWRYLEMTGQIDHVEEFLQREADEENEDCEGVK